MSHEFWVAGATVFSSIGLLYIVTSAELRLRQNGNSGVSPEKVDEE